MEKQSSPDTVRWSLLKNIWPFLVIIFMIAASWTTTTLQVSQLRVDLTRIQQDYIKADTSLANAIDAEVRLRSSLTDMRNAQVSAIAVDLAAIKVDIAWIKDSLQDRVIMSGG
jgi:hypothetical protein